MNARVFLVLTLALLAACGGGSNSGPVAKPVRFLYANAYEGPNTFNAQVYGFAVYGDGSLSALAGFSPIEAGNYGGGPLVVTPDSRFLYITGDGIPAGIAVCGIAVDGALGPCPALSLTLPGTPVGLAAHPAGDFLYASSNSGVLSVLAVNSDTGALTLTSSAPLGSSIASFSSAVITPDGRYLYQTYFRYSGAVQQSPATVEIAGFSVDAASGALSAAAGSPVAPAIPGDSSVVLLAMDPGGRFLYAGYASPSGAPARNGVAVFAIEPSTGALTEVPGSPLNLATPPSSLAPGVSGRLLIVSSTVSGSCSFDVFSVDSGSGALAPVAGSPFGPLATDCGSIAVDPTLPFVYAAAGSQAGPGAVLTLALDVTTGALAYQGQTVVPGSENVGVASIALTH